MSSHPSSLASSPWPGRTQGHRTSRRGLLLAGLLAALACLLLGPALARADTPSTLHVIGTSDVSDSGLIPNVIQPGFEKAYPQFSFTYKGTATGTAISQAESGAAQASVLIVHAASLENQFVAGGYSYQNQYGRALFINDFVLAGPNGDPAGATAGAPHNIAQAFADVAAAGIQGKATFVSRGGTPGTTVEEHKLWALVASSNLAPSGLLLCAVNATEGGGETPIAPNNGVTASGQACPNGGALPSGSQLPSWYATTNLEQGPNVIDANACNGFPSGANTCYVLTDRGTFDYLASGTDPAGSIPNLKIVTRENAATAPGGADELINYFHGYVINPSKPGETVNLTAAQDFITYITSAAVQAKIATYLAHTSDPAGAPFIPDASPTLTVTGLPKNATGGKPFTVKGTVTNAEPGYPAPSGAKVTVDQIVGTTAIPVASVKTSKTGAYSIRFSPPATGSYEVTTGLISQVEVSTLNPVFGDTLTPGATVPSKITVHSQVRTLRIIAGLGRVLLVGTVAPGTEHLKATVTVYARSGTKGAFRKVVSDRLAASDGNFAVAVARAAGPWEFKVRFADGKQIVASNSGIGKVTVGPKAPGSVSLRSVTVKSGRVTVSGRISPSAAAGGDRVTLLALRTGGTGPDFATVAKTTVSAGKTTFTLHATLKRGYHWVLELASAQTGSDSGLRTVNVK